MSDIHVTKVQERKSSASFLVYGYGQIPIIPEDIVNNIPVHYAMPGGAQIEDYDAAVRVAKFIDKQMKRRY